MNNDTPVDDDPDYADDMQDEAEVPPVTGELADPATVPTDVGDQEAAK